MEVKCTGSSRKLCSCNDCYKRSFAYILEEKNKLKLYSDKNKNPAKLLLPYSREKILINCDKCPHTFETIPSNITSGKWCKYCCEGYSELCNKVSNGCDYCYKRSLISHERARKCYLIENKIPIHNILLHSNTKVKFKCDKCFHNFEMSPDNIVKGKWDDYCNNNGRTLCDVNECTYCYNKSFASHKKSKYIINENPRKIMKHSGNSYNFSCFDCKHTFTMRIADITGEQSSWCPYCSIPTKKLCDKLTECLHCFERSFASHPMSKFWDYKKNEIIPRNICKSANSNYNFICKNNHNFLQSPGHIMEGKWCPNCKNHTETKLLNELRKKYFDVKFQFKSDWCKNETTNQKLPFDFLIPSYNIIIELDGLQHFKQVMNWKTPKEQRENDIYKMKCANENNYSIIRILQEDVLYDKYDWLDELKNKIENIKNNKKIQNIYMCKNNEYKDYIESL
jgi:very-short-patch-repair endonuclease